MLKNQNHKISSKTIIKEYQNYLQNSLGITKNTIYHYTYNVKKFLKYLYDCRRINFDDIKPLDICNFITNLRKDLNPGTIQNITTALKSFFKFLQVNGLCKRILIETIPTIPYWKFSKVPGQLSNKDLQKFMDSFDNKTPLGLRNKTMIMFLTKLGLRSCEVANLSLDDIDWKSGVIKISKNKSRRTDHLPLLKEVGTALVNYLKKGRLITKDRHIFINHGNKKGIPISSDAVRYVVRKGYKKAKLRVPSRPTHILRHTLASQMIQRGVTIKEIADILRHRCLDTTMIYTKINLSGLNDVVMSWPEVKS